MRWFYNWSIKYKILSIVVVGIIGFGVYFAANMLVASKNTERLLSIRDVYFPVLELSDSSIVYFSRIKETLNGAVTSNDADMIDDALNFVQASKENFKSMLAINSSNSDEINDLKSSLVQYSDTSTALTRALVSGSLDLAQAKPRIDAMDQAMKTYSQNLSEFREGVYKKFTKAVDEAEQTSRQALMAGAVIGTLLLLMLTGLGWFVAGNVTANINSVVDSLRDLVAGEGDLSKRLESHVK